MNTRKIILLTVPVIVVVLIVLGALLTFILNTANTAPVSQVPSEQMGAVETPAAPVVEDATPAQAPADGKPTVTYQNEE